MIELRALSAGYDKTKKIHDINLRFEKNAITAVIGPNGCGKSTLLKAAARLLPPFGGSVLLEGVDISHMKADVFARRVSFLPQSRNIPAITVRAMVMHGRFPHQGFLRKYRPEDYAAVSEAMHKTGISHLASKDVSKLSGGERQKVYLAMVLAQQTDVLFLDEPTTYLDINHQLEILRLVNSLKQEGKTVILVLHDLNLALQTCDHIVLLQDGRIAAQGTPVDICESRSLEEVFSIQTHCQQIGQTTHYCFTPIERSAPCKTKQLYSSASAQR